MSRAAVVRVRRLAVPRALGPPPPARAASENDGLQVKANEKGNSEGSTKGFDVEDGA